MKKFVLTLSFLLLVFDYCFAYPIVRETTYFKEIKTKFSVNEFRSRSSYDFIEVHDNFKDGRYGKFLFLYGKYLLAKFLLRST